MLHAMHLPNNQYNQFTLTLKLFAFVLLLGLWKVGASNEGAALLVGDFADLHCNSERPFEGTVLWDLGDQFEGQVQLRIGSATGNLFVASDDAAGEARTGKWVVPGMKFVLLDQADGTILAEYVVELPPCEDQAVVAADASETRTHDGSETRTQEGPASPPAVRAPSRPVSPPQPPRPEDLARTELDDRATLELSPPRLRYCGLPVDRASVTVRWDIAELGIDRAQIYVNSLDGQLFASGGTAGERITGDWVTNGMRFLLFVPELGRVVAKSEFRILPCNVVDYPD